MPNRTPVRVTYVTPGTDKSVTIRHTDGQLATICQAAIDLKATHFVAREGEHLGLFDMRTARKNTPVPGEWSINDPIKLFPLDAEDAAVMYALTKRRT